MLFLWNYLKNTIFRLLKKLFAEKQEVVPTQQQINIFNETLPGDVVFCKMPLSEKELAKVPEGHKNRPYLIVEKTEQGLWGYPCTTHPHKNLKNYSRYCFPRVAYKKDCKKYVDSYVEFKQCFLIPIQNIMFYMRSIEDYQRQKIQKHIIVSQNHTKKKLYNFSIPIHYSPGDMILYKEQSYYVFSVNKKELFCLKVYRKKSKETDVPLKGKGSFNYVDITEKIRLEIQDLISILYICTPEEQEEIASKYKEFKHRSKKADVVRNKISYFQKYQTGTVLEDRFSQQEYVYLFNVHKKAYGINIEKGEDGQMCIEAIDISYMDSVDELMDSCVKNILEEIMNTKSYFLEVVKDIYCNSFVSV